MHVRLSTLPCVALELKLESGKLVLAGSKCTFRASECMFFFLLILK